MVAAAVPEALKAVTVYILACARRAPEHDRTEQRGVGVEDASACRRAETSREARKLAGESTEPFSGFALAR